MNAPDAGTPSLDFGPLLDTLLQGYVDRPAIEREIADSLVSAPRFCVVVGEPGSGKTCLAARLIRSGGFLHHFLRKGHVEFGLWRDPYAFLTSIGFQLMRRYGDALFPQRVRLDLQGHVRDVEKGAVAVGSEVGELVAVPWHSGNWRVRMEASRIAGEAVGVRIDKIVADYRGIPLVTYRQMALIDPLLRLRNLTPEERVTLWVDGLDEEERRSGPEVDSPSTIGELLPTTEELEELPNLSVAVSSRRGSHLDRFIDARATELAVEDSRFAEDNAIAAHSYTSQALEEPAVLGGLEKAGVQAEEVQKQLTSRAEVNFLYLRHFFEAVRRGDADVVISGGLPESLDEIYVRLMRRLANRSPDFLTFDYPVLSSLCVAHEPLSTTQLTSFTKQSVAVVNDVVKRLLGFLDISGRDPARYAPYHISLAQTLTHAGHHDEVWYVDMPEAHGLIAGSYIEAIEEGWHGVDEYGFKFAAEHIANATPKLRIKLLDLLGSSWRVAKRSQSKSNKAFEADLDRAAQVAHELPLAEDLVHTSRLAYMRALVREAETSVPPAALEVLAGVGEIHRALDYVRAGLDPLEAVERLASILRGLDTGGPESRELAHDVLREGLRWASLGARGVNSELYLLGLLEAAPASADHVMFEFIKDAQKILSDSSRGFWTHLVFLELARLLTPLDALEATRAFESVADGLSSVDRTTIRETAARLIRYWSNFDPTAVAGRLGGMDVPLTFEVAAAFLELARMLDLRGESDSAASWRHAVTSTFVQLSPNAYDSSRLFSEIARSQVERRDIAGAASTLEAALGSAEQLLADEEGEASKEDRQRYPVALAYAAEVGLDIDRTKSEQALSRAWASLKQWGYWEEWLKDVNLRTLVRAQYRANPDLLRVQIESLQDPELKAKARLAATNSIAANDPRSALALVEESLLEAERPLGASVRNEHHLALAASLREDVYVRLGEAVVVEERASAESLMTGVQLRPSARVHWQIGVLEKLADREDPSARQWAEETVRMWGEISDDRQILFELPSLLSRLPSDLTSDLALAIDSLQSADHAFLLQAAMAPIRALSEESAGADAALIPTIPQREKEVLSDHHLLAYLAGQLWSVRRAQGEQLWMKALLRFRDATFSWKSRDSEYWSLIETFMHGSRSGLLPHLLALNETLAPDSDGLLWSFPMPGQSEYQAAQMSKPRHLLAIALAQALVDGEQYVEEHTRDLMPLSIRSLALSIAAGAARDRDVELRLSWCEEALRAAEGSKPDPLRCLLLADAATAFERLGLRERSRGLAKEIVAHVSDYRGKVTFYRAQDAGYAHALGRCLPILAAPHPSTATDAIEAASALGREGVLTLFCYLPSVIASLDRTQLHRFPDLVVNADALFQVDFDGRRSEGQQIANGGMRPLEVSRGS
jgi:hypothetical protein